MTNFNAAKANRPHSCCRDSANLYQIMVPGDPGAGVIARQGEQCAVCGCRHFGATLAPFSAGVQPATLGG